jgi:O-succinylbenzoic acid--CoA ligase
LKDLLLNGHALSEEEIDTYMPESDQERSALEFIRQWNGGVHQFKLMTSGSTGTPRSINASRELMTLSATTTIKHFGLTANDHACIVMDTSFIAGRMMIARALIADMKLSIFEPSREPSIDKCNCTFTAVAPLQLKSLLRAGMDLKPYKCILVGGAPLDRQTLSLISEMDINLYETYGMTETLSHIAVRKIAGADKQKNFTVIHQLELDTDKRECLRLRGTITGNKWLQTNDRVKLIGEHGFRWLGRADWTINSGGFKIQPELLEDKIQNIVSSEGWSNAFFIHGFPHPDFGEAAVIIFEGSLPDKIENIMSVLREHLNKYEVPRKILSVPLFKRTSTSKLLRQQTAKLLPPFSF